MSEVTIASPISIQSEQMTRADARVFDSAVQDLSAVGDATFVTDEAVAALETVMPALNKVGWAVIRNALSQDFITQAEAFREHITGHSMETNHDYLRLLASFNPTLLFMEKISIIGVEDDTMEPGLRRISDTWDGLAPHYDSGDGHTFLGNPIVDHEAAPYVIGSEADAQFDPRFAAVEVDVTGADLLVLAAGAVVPCESNPDTLTDNTGENINLAPRTLVHQRPTSSTDYKRRLRFIAFQRGERSYQADIAPTTD